MPDFAKLLLQEVVHFALLGDTNWMMSPYPPQNWNALMCQMGELKLLEGSAFSKVMSQLQLWAEIPALRP